ncbi:MAG TPA: NAD(P)-dependent oxidoreductase [Thermoanaerobaculia bacterium]|nr:NAD(P)-dependent oxidoreductase [Thermoanaerobaculia bacterium]
MSSIADTTNETPSPIETTSATTLITGAAGNLGSLLARHLASNGHRLRLMVHQTPLPYDLQTDPNATVVRADLSQPGTLLNAVEGSDVVVHFAGVLFSPRPERFLPETNTQWFLNLLDACVRARVKKVILISFPHVEGPTTVAQPATGRTDRHPASVHAQTRLAEERLLLESTRGTNITPVVLRLGMVYGRGILMIDAARWLARLRLLAVWNETTWIQLISTADYLRATEAAIVRSDVSGIYHVGDEQPVTLQSFLEQACRVWGCPPPHRLPLPLIYAAAWFCEAFGVIARTRSPLTRDFITIGRVSYWGDTTRTRKELLPTLQYRMLAEGLGTL